MVEERETLKKQHIKKHNIKLKYITDKTVFKIPCNGVIWDWHSVAMLHYWVRFLFMSSSTWNLTQTWKNIILISTFIN